MNIGTKSAKKAFLKSAINVPLLSFKSPLSKVIFIFSYLPSVTELPSRLVGISTKLNCIPFLFSCGLFFNLFNTSPTLNSAIPAGSNCPKKFESPFLSI